MTTTLITVEPDRWERLEDMFDRACQLVNDEALKNRKLLLTAKEVAAITGYDEKTIKRKKDDIGYRIGFTYQDLKFPYDNVIAWVQRGCIPPKPLPTHKK